MTTTAEAPPTADRVRGWEDGWRPNTDRPCEWCGSRDGIVTLAGLGDDLVHRRHDSCVVPAGRRWSTSADPTTARPSARVRRGQVEATVARGERLLYALAYSTGAVFTRAAWRKDAEKQGIPEDLMRIAVHRVIRHGWIEALDLVDGKVELEQRDRRDTRFVSLIHRPRGRRR